MDTTYMSLASDTNVSTTDDMTGPCPGQLAEAQPPPYLPTLSSTHPYILTSLVPGSLPQSVPAIL